MQVLEAQTFEVATKETEAEPIVLPRRDQVSLMVLSGPESGQHFRIPQLGGIIGRSSNAEVALTDPFISRTHARLRSIGRGRMVITDEGSKFGVWVEGKRIEALELRDGDRIQLSKDTVLRVRLQDPGEAELIEQLQHAALTDPLTDLGNRRYLEERLEQEWSYATRHRTRFCLLLVDIDRFKDINDTEGHAVGDRVIRQVAESLKRTVRKEDVVARYGGDELVVLSRGIGAKDGIRCAERIRSGVLTREPLRDVAELNVTVSIGVAAFDPSAESSPASVAELCARADAALYTSKNSGRDCVTEWSEVPADSKRPDLSRAETLDIHVTIPNDPTKPS